jgi:hypothetical protein
MRTHDFINCKFCGIHTEDAKDRWGTYVDRNGLCARCRSAIYKVTHASPSLTVQVAEFVEGQSRYNFEHGGFVPQDLRKKYALKRTLPEDEFTVRHWSHEEIASNQHHKELGKIP